MFLIDDLVAAKVAGKLLPVIIGATVFFGSGFGAGELYEYKAPWGLYAQRNKLRDRLDAEIPAAHRLGFAEGLKAQVAADAKAFVQWGDVLKSCRIETKAARDAAALSQKKLESFASAQASASFRLGRATCGKSTNAPATLPGSPPPPPAGPIVPGRLPAPGPDDDLGAIANSGAVTFRP